MNDLTMDDCTLSLLSSEDGDEVTCSQECDAGNRECEMAVLEEDWVRVQARATLNIFLSHSGAQKDFVEQLREDLERAGQSPFFDKRTNSLPKGEEFAGRIFTAAEECDLAIVVVSEEYFTRTKWPMQELVALSRAPGCKKILPLFFGISCKEFKNPERRRHWYQV